MRSRPRSGRGRGEGTLWEAGQLERHGSEVSRSAFQGRACRLALSQASGTQVVVGASMVVVGASVVVGATVVAGAVVVVVVVGVGISMAVPLK